MNEYSRTALNAYTKHALENEVSSASPHKLILMLFDGALASIALAKSQIENRQVAEKGRSLSKAIAIIEEGLRLSLDKNVGGELAQNLDALYEYMSHRLLMANIGNDLSALEEVTRLLGLLRGAWEEMNPSATPVQPSDTPPAQTAGASYGKA